VSGIVGLLLVSLSVGLSNFAGAIGIGLSGINSRTRIRVGLAFGFFEALMPLLGLLLGQAVAGFIGGRVAGYVAGGILILTGAYTIWQGWGLEHKKTPPQRMQMHSLIVTAMALSIDNLAVGFALAVYHVQIVLAAVLAGYASCVSPRGILVVGAFAWSALYWGSSWVGFGRSPGMSLLGLELGHRLGRRIEGWSEELGGAMLILVGIAIATGVLG